MGPFAKVWCHSSRTGRIMHCKRPYVYVSQRIPVTHLKAIPPTLVNSLHIKFHLAAVTRHEPPRQLYSREMPAAQRNKQYAVSVSSPLSSMKYVTVGLFEEHDCEVCVCFTNSTTPRWIRLVTLHHDSQQLIRL